MGIESPETYGEFYWAKQVDAQKLFALDSETELTAMAARLMDSLGIKAMLPIELSNLISEIEAPAGAFLSDVGGRFVSEVADGAVSKTANPLLESIGYMAYMKWPTKKLTPEATATLFSRKRIDKDFFDERLRMGGFEPVEARFQYDAMRPYPTIPDIITYARYHGDPGNPYTTAFELFDIDPIDWPVWEWLGKQRLTTLQLQMLYKRGLIDESTLAYHLTEVGWSGANIADVTELSWVVPNAMLLVQGDLQQKISTDQILKDISIADINPKYAQTYLDAILTKPSTIDLIAYELRQDPKLTNLPVRLEQIGIHPDYIDVYKTLAYPIPPVADIITMAVREAFTPEIAARFGQYEDYPQQLEEWAEKKGLSPEWSQRYWAAHWSLPSAQQGFEMLHRGVIDFTELNMLLRALDVMPFWRDKLTSIAYRRLTRVDIRRMYAVGVLTETEVYEAYLELGYNDRDARRMSDFTVKQTLATQSKFTSRDIITAYSNYIINRSEASTLLREVGVKEENISFIISTADYKRDWELTESRIEAIHNLYRQCTYTGDQARSELLKLALPSVRVDVLMERWYLDAKDQPSRFWTAAQTIGFIKADLITEARGRKELSDIGYDTEHINVLLAIK